MQPTEADVYLKDRVTEMNVAAGGSMRYDPADDAPLQRALEKPFATNVSARYTIAAKEYTHLLSRQLPGDMRICSCHAESCQEWPVHQDDPATGSTKLATS